VGIATFNTVLSRPADQHRHEMIAEGDQRRGSGPGGPARLFHDDQSPLILVSTNGIPFRYYRK